MKKIFLTLGIGLLLASCTDEYEPWAEPQSNAEEAAQSVSFTVANAPAIDYATITADSVQLFIPTINSTNGGETSFTSRLYNADRTKSVDISTSSAGLVSVDDLKNAVEQLYGKRPEMHELPIDIMAYTNVDGQSIANSGTATATVTLKAPFIDTAYYLTGDFAGWNKEGALAFTHLGNGDVYDNPEYQIVFTTTADNQYWKIISGTNYENDFWAEGETGVVGTTIDGDTSFEGNLTTAAPQAGKIETAGIYRMTINMMNYTYKIEKLDFKPYVYFIGATDGWSASDQKVATTTFDGKYTGYVYIADPNGWGIEFKFQKNPGDWGDDSQLNSNNMATVSGDFEKTNDNFKASAGEGVYYVELDLAASTLKGTKINNMNLVGDFNGWNAGDDAQQMKWDAANFCYVIENAGVNANGWKFTTNNSWDINLGGNDSVEPSMMISDLVANGKNLGVVGTTIKLYPTRKTSDNIYATVE
ncbi:MAG: DUF5115 domain-containing protein [Prevotella sp.]|nr:DUF5115 domain-containing protein [Prevotella sp.]